MYTLQPATTPKTKNMIWRIFAAAVLVAVVVSVAFGTFIPRANPRVFNADGQQVRGPALPVASTADACFMAQKFVKENLKAPASAIFPDNCKTTQSAGTWVVMSFVDSQNGFGAMIRSDTVVQMTYDPTSENWTLLNITINSR